MYLDPVCLGDFFMYVMNQKEPQCPGRQQQHLQSVLPMTMPTKRFKDPDQQLGYNVQI